MKDWKPTKKVSVEPGPAQSRGFLLSGMATGALKPRLGNQEGNTSPTHFLLGPLLVRVSTSQPAKKRVSAKRSPGLGPTQAS